MTIEGKRFIEALLVGTALLSNVLFAAPVGPEPQREYERSTTCGKDAQNFKPTPFDPACYVRILEDSGNNRRYVLYSYDDPRSFTRHLKADSESKIVIDLAHGLDANQDVGLNQFSVRAELKTANASKPIEVIGYSEIGISEEERSAQRAFGLQTFTNLSSKLFTLYYTLKDFLTGMEAAEPEACVQYILDTPELDTVSPAFLSEKCATLRLTQHDSDLTLLKQSKAAEEKKRDDARATSSRLEEQIAALRKEVTLRQLIARPECNAGRVASTNCSAGALARRDTGELEERLRKLEAAKKLADDSVAGSQRELTSTSGEIEKVERQVQDSTAAAVRFKAMFSRHGAKLKSLAEFFEAPENQTVAAGVAAKVFHVDKETVQLVAKTIRGRIVKLESDDLTEEARLAGC